MASVWFLISYFSVAACIALPSWCDRLDLIAAGPALPRTTRSAAGPIDGRFDLIVSMLAGMTVAGFVLGSALMHYAHP